MPEVGQKRAPLVILAVVAADRTGGTEDTVKKVERLRKPVVIVGQ